MAADSSSTDWLGNLINAAVAYYGIHSSTRAPKTYDVPLTPGEQWTTDTRKNLYNYASGYTDQFLQGLNGLQPDFRLPTSAVGNPEFMGGIKIPKIDFSKLPSIAGAPTTTTPGGTTKPPGNDPGSGPTGVAGDPFGHVTSPAGGPGDPFAGLPDEYRGKIPEITDWISRHKGDIVKYGVEGIAGIIASQFGVPASWASGIAGRIYSHFAGPNIAPRPINWPDASVPVQRPDKNFDPGTEPINPKPYDPNDPSTWNASPIKRPLAPPYTAVFDPAGFGDQRPFNNNLGSAPGQDTGETTGGTAGFGYGRPYDDTMRPTLPGRPGYGGAGSRAGAF